MAHTMLYFHSFLVFFVWTRFAFAQVPRVIEFNVTWIKAAPDGYERDVITINGVWPPSPIHVAKNEVYLLRVYNGLNDGECITGNNPASDAESNGSSYPWNRSVGKQSL